MLSGAPGMSPTRPPCPSQRTRWTSRPKPPRPPKPPPPPPKPPSPPAPLPGLAGPASSRCSASGGSVSARWTWSKCWALTAAPQKESPTCWPFLTPKPIGVWMSSSSWLPQCAAAYFANASMSPGAPLRSTAKPVSCSEWLPLTVIELGRRPETTCRLNCFAATSTYTAIRGLAPMSEPPPPPPIGRPPPPAPRIPPPLKLHGVARALALAWSPSSFSVSPIFCSWSLPTTWTLMSYWSCSQLGDRGPVARRVERSLGAHQRHVDLLGLQLMVHRVGRDDLALDLDGPGQRRGVGRRLRAALVVGGQADLEHHEAEEHAQQQDDQQRRDDLAILAAQRRARRVMGRRCGSAFRPCRRSCGRRPASS